MILFEEHAVLRHPVEDVFALTVDLQRAPHWHSFFTSVEQLTPDPIGTGSRWRIGFGMGSFTLEITEYQSPSRVAFEGSRVFGVSPNFTIELKTISEGTAICYQLNPDIPALLRPLMAVIAPPYGRRDLARYFREMDSMLAGD